ncbi:OmpA family protein [Sphingomonas cavernae]|uniref:OmpA family protein n=2 Tax=Sphingomonas cavernae TaxID=2320861 RepID=A0A418WSH4_9SPHN|nr:OmpA family protein [Sphingomonas cavernae]
MIVAAAALVPGQASAQVSPRSPLLDLDRAELRSQIDSRYQSAVQATQASEIKRSADSRFVWAAEAKVQCGIALGYLKSGTRDEASINKCDGFSTRMAQASAPAPVAAAPAPAPGCGVDPSVSVFFDWNADAPLAEAQATVQQMVASRASCGWTRLAVTGHADRSGSDDYNVGISTRRANNIAAMLENAGVAVSDMTVSGKGESELKIETADGVREPMNRRVEISAQ